MIVTTFASGVILRALSTWISVWYQINCNKILKPMRIKYIWRRSTNHYLRASKKHTQKQLPDPIATWLPWLWICNGAPLSYGSGVSYIEFINMGWTSDSHLASYQASFPLTPIPSIKEVSKTGVWNMVILPYRLFQIMLWLVHRPWSVIHGLWLDAEDWMLTGFHAMLAVVASQFGSAIRERYPWLEITAGELTESSVLVVRVKSGFGSLSLCCEHIAEDH